MDAKNCLKFVSKTSEFWKILKSYEKIIKISRTLLLLLGLEKEPYFFQYKYFWGLEMYFYFKQRVTITINNWTLIEYGKTDDGSYCITL